MQYPAARRSTRMPIPPRIGPDMDLERFVRIQDQPVQRETEYERAIREIRGGRILNQWLWYIFPRVFGLGRHPNSRLYGIKSVEEARAYLAHPVLGPRLRDAIEAVLESRERDIDRLFGGKSDANKFKSSMTLFAWVSLGSEDDFLIGVIEELWDGSLDEKTLRILEDLEDRRRDAEGGAAE
ncbi:hypothetical protein VPNG_03593 [Cytospora leucostoma]|uniref:Calpastatin n=1 Tax=Cytospora leucostoma TaxID=1230097 RepID=A0A423XCY0_9PEZI|nr:hypothetical protein VPNG_03593 [Cytospora leucostoma]